MIKSHFFNLRVHTTFHLILLTFTLQCRRGSSRPGCWLIDHLIDRTATNFNYTMYVTCDKLRSAELLELNRVIDFSVRQYGQPVIS